MDFLIWNSPPWAPYGECKQAQCEHCPYGHSMSLMNSSHDPHLSHTHTRVTFFFFFLTLALTILFSFTLWNRLIKWKILLSIVPIHLMMPSLLWVWRDCLGLNKKKVACSLKKTQNKTQNTHIHTLIRHYHHGPSRFGSATGGRGGGSKREPISWWHLTTWSQEGFHLQPCPASLPTSSLTAPTPPHL